ncbi:MAG: peptide ABC transporter substrate-binding protein [Ktedonobacteraceae bacterium]|nr:peptide ABC transporter substrate-binding protein [Ktedonobacteraceae bacterium]
MQQSKRLTAGILPTLFCIMAILLAACGGTNNQPGSTGVTKAPVDKQVYVAPEAGVSDIATFDPALSTDLPSISAIDMVFTGLVQLNDKLEVQCQECSSYKVGSDGVTWTFTLKPNLKFSDGTPLTATDVVYSIDRALQPALHSTVAPIYLALVKDADKLGAGKIKTIIGDSVTAVDATTVQIVANKQATYFLDALTYSCSYTVEKSLVDKYGKNFTDHLTEGGGAGPFKVQDWTHGKQITFVPNSTYYGKQPQLQKVIFPFYKQSDTTYRAYQVGQVDITGIPSANYEAAQKRADFHKVPQLWINYYAMNYLAKPFDSINMRKAFALAINKDEIAHAVWKDQYIPTNHIVPKGMPGYNADLKGPDGTTSTKGNPTAAQQFFQAGLKDEGLTSASQLPPIKLTYPTGSTEADNEVAVMVQQFQRVLGISVKPDPIEFNRLLTEITAATGNPNGLQFWGIAWIADYPDPQDWLTLQFDKSVPNNNMSYGQNHSATATQQQAVQTAMEQADVAPAGPARIQAYNAAEQQLVNDVAWMPMEQVTNTYLLKPFVQGLIVNPQNIVPPEDWGNIYISTH